MKLCFITREAPPNLMGGIGTYVANMTELLAGEGHEVTLITQWQQGAPGRGLEQSHTSPNGVRVYYLPFVLDNWAVDSEIHCPEVAGLSQLDISAVFAWAVADALDKLIPRHGFEYIEAAEYEAPLSIFLNRRAMRPAEDPSHAIPCVVQLHSPSHLIFENNDEDTGTTWIQHRKRFEMASIAMADAVLAPSEYLARQVAEALGQVAGSYKVIPYPLGKPLPEWQFEDNRPAGFHCLYVGRIEPRKGVFEWVEAACEVLQQFPNTYFHFVGGPHMRETRAEGGRSTAEILKSFIPEHLKANFLFHDYLPREELGRHYYHADCCAVPSRWDNYPNTCMEAMRCGKLVLASDQGGMAEMIQDGQSGLIAKCAYGDRIALKNALKSTLIKAIETPLKTREAMGLAARERIEAICDNAEILRRHADWRSQLLLAQRKKIATHPPSADLGRLYIAVFTSASCAPQVLERTVQSVVAQSSAKVIPILLRNAQTQHTEIPVVAKDWHTLTTSDMEPQHSAGYPKDIFKRLLESSAKNDYWCFITPGMHLKPEFASQCLHFLQNNPQAGYCLPWTYSNEDGKVIARSGLDASELLLDPKSADLFCVFRQGDLQSISELSPTGYYLGDILRDFMLKLDDKGHPGYVLPAILGETHWPTDPCCLSNFCLHHPADSHFELLLAHKAKLDLNLLFHQHTTKAQPSRTTERSATSSKGSLLTKRPFGKTSRLQLFFKHLFNQN